MRVCVLLVVRVCVLFYACACIHLLCSSHTLYVDNNPLDRPHSVSNSAGVFHCAAAGKHWPRSHTNLHKLMSSSRRWNTNVLEFASSRCSRTVMNRMCIATLAVHSTSTMLSKFVGRRFAGTRPIFFAVDTCAVQSIMHEQCTD